MHACALLLLLLDVVVGRRKRTTARNVVSRGTSGQGANIPKITRWVDMKRCRGSVVGGPVPIEIAGEFDDQILGVLSGAVDEARLAATKERHADDIHAR